MAAAAARLDQAEGKEANIDFKEAEKEGERERERGRNQVKRKVNRSPDVRDDKSARGRSALLRFPSGPFFFPLFFLPSSSLLFFRLFVCLFKWSGYV